MDIIVIVIFGFSIFLCYQKGLVMSLFGMFRLIIALFIAINLAAPVGGFIRNSEIIYGLVYSAVSATITPNMPDPGSQVISDIANPANVTNLIRDFSAGGTDLRDQAEVIRQIDIPSSIINGVLSHETAHRIIAEYITGLVITVIAVILIFIAALICLKVLAKSLDTLARLPIINIANKLGGILVGFVQGYAIVWIIITIIRFLPFNEFMASCYYLIENSRIASMFV